MKETYDENARGDYRRCVGFIAGGESLPRLPLLSTPAAS